PVVARRAGPARASPRAGRRSILGRLRLESCGVVLPRVAERRLPAHERVPPAELDGHGCGEGDGAEEYTCPFHIHRLGSFCRCRSNMISRTPWVLPFPRVIPWARRSGRALRYWLPWDR